MRQAQKDEVEGLFCGELVDKHVTETDRNRLPHFVWEVPQGMLCEACLISFQPLPSSMSRLSLLSQFEAGTAW